MSWSDDPRTFLTCLVPSVLFLAYVRSMGRERPESWPPLALTFVLGMVSAAITFFLFEHLEAVPVYRPLFSGTSEDDIERVTFFLAVVAPIEESWKLAAVLAADRMLRSLDRPADGLVYSSASALGFATAENWYAMWATGGPDWGRAAVVPFVHMLFSAFWGAGLAKTIRERRRSWPVYSGFALASGYHGLYNFLEYKGGLWHFITLPIVALLWLYLLKSFAAFANPAIPRVQSSEDREQRRS